MINRDDTKLAGFVFKGQMTSLQIDKLLAKSSPTAKMSFDDIAGKVSLALLDEEAVADAQKMSAVYIAIASFENMVRDLIASRLLEEKGANWWDVCVNSDVKKRSEDRRKQEEQIRWHQARGLNPIYFTEISDLLSIIQGNWAYFVDLIHDVEWARTIFKTIDRSRNVIMHSGQLSMNDIERLGMLIRDWLRQVGG